jgi:hypothetical protein
VLDGRGEVSELGRRKPEAELRVVVRAWYRPMSNWARASASRAIRDSGSVDAACASTCTAAAASPLSSSSSPRTYQS